MARPARSLRRSLLRHRLGHAGLWRLSAAFCGQYRDAGRRLAGFSAADRRNQTCSRRAFDRRHDRPAMAGEISALGRCRRSCADQPGLRQGRRRLAEILYRRTARPARSRRNACFAPANIGEGVGGRQPRCQWHGDRARLYGQCSRSELSRQHAGAVGVRPAQRAQGYQDTDAAIVGLEGQERAGADDGEDGDLYSLGKLCRTRRGRPSRQSRTPASLQHGAGSIPEDNRSGSVMTAPISKTANTTDVALDAPIFDPTAFRLSDEQASIIARARELGQTVFAGRAAAYDRDATFPTENYRDLHRAGLLGIAIPKKHGGLGVGYQTYALAAAEIGRYCGARALTWNMHVCSTLWSGPLAADLDMDAATRAEHERRRAIHYRRIIDDGAIYSQPFSGGGAAAAGGVAFGTEAKPVKGGWIVNGKKIFASLSGHADYYGVLCTEMAEGAGASRRNTLYLALPAKAEGLSVVGDWDPLGMRGTVSRTLLFKDVFVAEDAALMPRGVYFQAAMRWPHMFLTLSPTYMGLAQAAYDFTVRYLRGEVPGTPPVKRRMYPTKQIAVAQMQIKLEQIKAIWFQAVTEARANPTKEQVLRAYAAQYSTMEGANEIATLAIRTCGGQAMLKSLPLERIYRDSRCGSLMLPWTAELCLDRIGREALYESGESDD